MIRANSLKKDDLIILESEIHKVLEASHMKKARQGATVQLKLKNLLTGATISRTFGSGERFEEADLKKRELEFIYNHKDEYVFSDASDKSQRFSLSKEKIGAKTRFLKGGLRVSAEYFDDNLIDVILPIKAEYKVIAAPPNVRGNTAGAATKSVTIETGAQIQTPLFVEEGDIIRVNTEKEEYVERAQKSG
jgi:elongation factor P